VILQRYKDGDLADAKVFRLADGLTWRAGRIAVRTETDLRPWLAERGTAGRLPPNGFSKVAQVRAGKERLSRYPLWPWRLWWMCPCIIPPNGGNCPCCDPDIELLRLQVAVIWCWQHEVMATSPRSTITVWAARAFRKCGHRPRYRQGTRSTACWFAASPSTPARARCSADLRWTLTCRINGQHVGDGNHRNPPQRSPPPGAFD